MDYFLHPSPHIIIQSTLSSSIHMQTTAATPLRLKISIPEGALPGTILSFSHPHDEEQEIQMVVQECMMFSSEFTLHHHGPTHPAAESSTSSPSSPSTPSLDLQHTAQDTSSSSPSKKQKIDVIDTVENLVQRYVLRVKEIAEKIRGQPFWTQCLDNHRDVAGHTLFKADRTRVLRAWSSNQRPSWVR